MCRAKKMRVLCVPAIDPAHKYEPPALGRCLVGVSVFAVKSALQDGREHHAQEKLGGRQASIDQDWP